MRQGILGKFLGISGSGGGVGSHVRLAFCGDQYCFMRSDENAKDRQERELLGSQIGMLFSKG
jgi:hypothetical protein